MLVNNFPIVVTVEDNTSSALGTPAIGSLYQGDQAAVDDSFIWASVLQRIRTTGTVKFTFELDGGLLNDGYDNVSFKLFDIDGVSTNIASVKPRQEKVVINGYNGTTAVNHTITGSSIHTINAANNSATSDFTDTDITGGNTSSGVVNVAFSSKITKFEIIFSIEQADAIPLSNTSTPGFSIYDILFTTSQPLPLSLYNFKTAISSDKSHVALSWEAGTTEYDTKYIIERSTDAIVFDAFGAATYLQGMGKFSYNDFFALQTNAIYYYRIKEIKPDNEINFSKIRSVNFQNGLLNEAATVYPNPVRDVFFVTINDAQKVYSFELYDSQGRYLQKMIPTEKTYNLYQFDSSNLSLKQGIYFLSILEPASGYKSTFRLLVE